MQEDSYEKEKVQKAQKSAKVAWECGTNEYFYLLYATILWCPSWQLSEDKSNNEIHLSALKELS